MLKPFESSQSFDKETVRGTKAPPWDPLLRWHSH